MLSNAVLLSPSATEAATGEEPAAAQENLPPQGQGPAPAEQRPLTAGLKIVHPAEPAVVGLCLDSECRRFETGDQCPFRNRLDERRVGTRGTVLPSAIECWIAMANWKLS
jgi:hypothetical protein